MTNIIANNSTKRVFAGGRTMSAILCSNMNLAIQNIRNSNLPIKMLISASKQYNNTN